LAGVAAAMDILGWKFNLFTNDIQASTVGFNPDAASYAGMNVGRNYVRVMLICGAFAGVAASLDIL